MRSLKGFRVKITRIRFFAGFSERFANGIEESHLRGFGWNKIFINRSALVHISPRLYKELGTGYVCNLYSCLPAIGWVGETAGLA